MAYFNKAELDEFYSIISNLFEREVFDNLADENGSRDICPALAKKAGEMTLDQLRKVTAGKWRNMAISGIAHVSWENGQWKDLYRAFIDAHGMIKRDYVERWSETWYEHFVTTWTGTVDGEEIAIVEDYRRPISFSSSGGSTNYYDIKPLSEIEPEPDTLVALIYIENGNAYLNKQFAGSREECDEWATKELTNCRNSDSVHIRTFSLK